MTNPVNPPMTSSAAMQSAPMAIDPQIPEQFQRVAAKRSSRPKMPSA